MSDENASSHQGILRIKHQEFVTWYLILWNATEAYKRVYPKSSDDAARANAARLIANDNVDAEIKRRIADKAMTADEVLSRLAEQARAEQTQYLTAQGVDLESLISAGKGHLVKGIKRTQFGDNVEFYDAQAALVHIGKHHGLFKDVSEIKAEIETRDVTELTDEQLARIAAISSGGTTKT